MSTEHDELARDIPTWQDLPFGGRNDCVKLDANAAHAIAGVLIEKGWTKPRIVRTSEELDALPVGSVVLCENRAFRRKTRTVEYQALDWEAPEFPFGCTSEWIWVHRPVTILHVGGDR